MKVEHVMLARNVQCYN